MSHALSVCPVRLAAAPFAGAARPTPRTVSNRVLIAAAAALGLLATSGSLTLRSAVSPAPIATPLRAATLIAMQAGDLAGLRDAAEAGRAAMLRVPGVGQVRIEGLQTASIDLYISPARLQRLGISPADLAAAVPVRLQEGRLQEGRLQNGERFSVQPEAADAGVQAIANLPVRAGQKVFRLGDVAAVARTILPNPISRSASNGRPAAHLLVIPTRAASSALPGRVAAALQSVALPQAVALTLGD